MSNHNDTSRSLLQRPGVAGPARVRAFPGISALTIILLTLGVLALTPAIASANSAHAYSGHPLGLGKGSAAGQMELASNSGVAVNDTTHDIYVADTGNRRVDEFEENGTFVRAWGWGVLAPGATGAGDLTSGSALVTGVLTSSGSFNVADTIAGPGISAGTTIVAVGAGTITLSAAAGASGTGVALTVAAGAGVVPTDARQSVLVDAPGTFTLGFSTPDPSNSEASTASLPFDASAGEVQSALEALSNVGAGNVTVSGEPSFTGEGDLSAATGTGAPTEHSPEVKEVHTTAGAFEVGQEISGPGIPGKTTIAKVVGSTITLSAPATETGVGVVLHAGSREVKDVTTTSGVYFVGEELTGEGIAPGTTIEAVEPITSTLTLSRLATEAGSGVAIAVLAPYTVAFGGTRFTDTDVDRLTAGEDKALITTLQTGGGGAETCVQATGCQVGVPGTSPGQLENPAFVAVDNGGVGDPSKGDVYVADTATKLVQKFTAEGELVKSWEVEGQLGTAPITVARATGNTAAGSSEVTEVKLISGRFHQDQEILGEGIPAGDFYAEKVEGPENILPLRKPATETKTGVTLTARLALGQPAGIAVDPAGDLWVGSGFPASPASEFAQGGGFVQEIFIPGGSSAANNVAVDGAGNVYLSSVAGTREFTSAGAQLPFAGPAGTGIAVDQATNELYIDRGSSIERVAAQPETFSSAQLTAGGGAGLTVDSSNGAVYAANTVADQLEAYKIVLEVNPEPGSASEVTATTATLNGEVNPKGTPVRECRFEYVPQSQFEEEGGDFLGVTAHEQVPCSPEAGAIGSGTSPVPVHAKIAGLLGGTAYRFRLVAVHENPVTHKTTTVAGNVEVFPTSTVPVVAGGEAVNVTSGTAELKATVNPEGLQVTHCVFEYGTSTEYGESEPCELSLKEIGQGAEPVAVSAQISGLAAEHDV